MKKIIFAILLFVISTVSYSQNCEILEEIVKASGGGEKISSIKSSYFEFKFIVHKENAGELLMKVWSKDNSKYYIEQSLKGMNIKMGIEGETGWFATSMSQGAENIPTKQVVSTMEFIKKSTVFDFFSNWKELGFTCEELGNVDIDDRKCYKLKVTDKENKNTVYYIDVITNLIYKQEATEMDRLIENVYKQYQKIEGIFLPKIIETYVDGTLGATLDILKIEVNPVIDDAKFKKP